MSGYQVHVPQEDGELAIAVDGGERRTWRVKDHVVSAANKAERDRLLLLVDGARRATASDLPAGETPDTDNLTAGAAASDTPAT